MRGVASDATERWNSHEVRHRHRNTSCCYIITIVNEKYLEVVWRKMYGLMESTTSISVRKCCEAIKAFNIPLVIPKLLRNGFKS